MGAWGGCCVFDHDRWIREVVPALRIGESHPLISEEIQRMGKSGRPLPRLAPFIPFQNDDSGDSPSPDSEGGWDFEELMELVERVLTRQCISHYANFGLRHNRVRDLLGDDVVGVDSAMHPLVEKLSEGSWAGNHGGYGEGIHGWLDPSRTEQFARGLSRVSVKPVDYEVDDGGEPVRWLGGRISDRARLATRIELLRKVVSKAVELRRGILWGSDLDVLYYARDHYGPQLPIELEESSARPAPEDARKPQIAARCICAGCRADSLGDRPLCAFCDDARGHTHCPGCGAADYRLSSELCGPCSERREVSS